MPGWMAISCHLIARSVTIGTVPSFAVGMDGWAQAVSCTTSVLLTTAWPSTRTAAAAAAIASLPGSYYYTHSFGLLNRCPVEKERRRWKSQLPLFIRERTLLGETCTRRRRVTSGSCLPASKLPQSLPWPQQRKK